MLLSPTLNDLLPRFLERDERLSFYVVFGEPSEWLPEHSGAQIDEALREARHNGLIAGDRQGADGSMALWSRVWLRVRGLQALGQWPPTGRECLPGMWDDGVWGRRARPKLQQLVDAPPRQGFLIGPAGGDEDPGPWLDWRAVLLLDEADLLAGQVSESGFDELQVTARGRAALDPIPRDPLDRAEAELRSGARAEAVVTAVELGLGQRLRQLAAAWEVPAETREGRPIGLSKLSADLRTAGVFDNSRRADVEAWLGLRNQLAHPQPATDVSDARVAALLAGVRVFLDEMPEPPSCT